MDIGQVNAAAEKCREEWARFFQILPIDIRKREGIETGICSLVEELERIFARENEILAEQDRRFNAQAEELRLACEEINKLQREWRKKK